MSSPTVGILALQGAFAEHKAAVLRLSLPICLAVILVRTPDDLSRCSALIIPGGESTTMALIAQRSGLLDPLREFVRSRPVWGTCAGAILMSKSVTGVKQGGQEILGGISISIARNGWGSQVESFEVPLHVEGLEDSENPFNGIFIRAPVVLELKSSSEEPPIQVIARLPSHLLPSSLGHFDDNDPRTIVALRQGLHMLTTFHPELTQDDRFHDYFIRHCMLGLGNDSCRRH